jgi:hypothetical protein
MVIVHGGASGFAQEIVVGRHRLMADEPEAQGGTDAGTDAASACGRTR